MKQTSALPNLPEIALRHDTSKLRDIQASHVLVFHGEDMTGDTIAWHAERAAALRRHPRAADKPAAKTVVSATLDGKLLVWAAWQSSASRFSQLTAARHALEILLKECPAEIAIVINTHKSEADAAAGAALQCALVNGTYELGKISSKSPPAPLARIEMFGPGKAFGAARVRALAAGNLLTRRLTARPPNDLTPARYRKDIAALAKNEGWQHREYDFKTLKKAGAGAFCAVAQGSPRQDAAIVHLCYRPKGLGKGSPAIALVGKGICMDTGGHGLKSAKGMYGMHEDMNGSAVAIGILKAASDLKLPVALDVWLAISENHISPEAYQPGDVVTALDGTTIEIVHTDAEGRMVLADTLTLAAREKPALLLDFATLTGAMISSLGNRMSGIFANDAIVGLRAIEAGQHSGERVVAFPMDEDYDAALDSKVADVKQCLMSGEADAIYAARFLSRFAGKTPWVHMDLSGYRCEGGLGGVSADLTGFGVAWGLTMIETQPAAAIAKKK